MTATVAPALPSAAWLPVMSVVDDTAPPMQADSSDARKRRREILSSQRITTTDDGNLSSASATSSSHEEPRPMVKKQRKVVVSSDDDDDAVSVNGPVCIRSTTTRGTAPKPQMKYDPDVPMTKEEATAWRRDQRRKRNRESAAASRQRQRDRIDELEAELSDWKTQFEAVQAKIRALEDDTPMEANLDPDRIGTPEPVISRVSLLASPTSSTFFDLAGEGDKLRQVELQQPKPIKMISRQA